MRENSKIVNEDVKMIIDDIEVFTNSLENKHVLIVGGRGFLGNYFLKSVLEINKLLKQPAKIIVIDNLITAKDTNKIEDSNVEFIQADISEKPEIDGQINFIIHAASIASPPMYRKYPLKTVDVNYLGTRNLLELAREKKIQSMLYLSSSEIYGDPTIIPTPESYWGYVSSVGPRACYDESKRLAETVSMLYYQQFGVPVKIARPFNVYGPYLNLNDGRVIPDFMRNAMEKSHIVLHSDGTPTRSFCYVTDAMRAFFRILLMGQPGSIFNVGNDQEVSMKTLAENVMKSMNKKTSLRFEESDDPNYTKDNPQRRCPDLTKAKELIGYMPRISLEEGLKRLYSWYTETEK